MNQMRASSSMSSIKNAKENKLDNIIKRSQELRNRRKEYSRRSSMGSVNQSQESNGVSKILNIPEPPILRTRDQSNGSLNGSIEANSKQQLLQNIS